MHVQNVRDFQQTKLDGKINSPFFLNEHGDTMNSLIKKIFEEEKRFDSGIRVYFGQGEDFKLTTELSKKVRYSCNQAIKNSLHVY